MLTIYSKNNCAACISAASYLTKLNIPFNVIKIDEDEEAKKFILSQAHKSVPQIYLGDKIFCFGGWPTLMKMSAESIKENIAAWQK